MSDNATLTARIPSPFADQPQTPPGLASEMVPVPDHGESSYLGSARLTGKER